MTEQKFLDRVAALYGAMLAATYLNPTPHHKRQILSRAFTVAEREMISPNTEFAWLIEREGGGVAPLYWAGSHWTADSLEAVRFSRSVDAVAACASLSGNHRVTEHGWG